MQYRTKELRIVVHPNNIMETTPTEASKGVLTLEEVDNNIAAYAKATKGKITGSIVHVTGAYVKKDVLKRYAVLDFDIVGTAIIAKSFTAKFTGNIFLALVQRITEETTAPVKIFTDKEIATKWILTLLSKAKK